MNRLFVAASLAAVTFAAPAVAAVFAGDTTSGPTFNRAIANGNAPPTILSGVGTAVRYVVTPFTVSASGGYDFFNATNYDSYLGVHAGSFNPANALENAVAYSDDFNGTLNGGFSGLNLLSGVNYFAISSGFDNTDFGAFTLTITGPGDVVGGSTGGVPEPASWAMLIAGFGLTGATMRRRRKVAATA